jgi:hypothetical protein
MKIRLITTLIVLTGLASCRHKDTVEDSVKAETWFIAKFDPLCDDSRGVFLDRNKLTKHGRLNPYDTVQVVNKDSVTISFDFITDCCRDFSGDVDLRQDTLFLKYGPSSNDTTRCDCYCDYRMTYRLEKGDRNWKSIKILTE